MYNAHGDRVYSNTSGIFVHFADGRTEQIYPHHATFARWLDDTHVVANAWNGEGSSEDNANWRFILVDKTPNLAMTILSHGVNRAYAGGGVWLVQNPDLSVQASWGMLPAGSAAYAVSPLGWAVVGRQDTGIGMDVYSRDGELRYNVDTIRPVRADAITGPNVELCDGLLAWEEIGGATHLAHGSIESKVASRTDPVGRPYGVRLPEGSRWLVEIASVPGFTRLEARPFDSTRGVVLSTIPDDGIHGHWVLAARMVNGLLFVSWFTDASQFSDRFDQIRVDLLSEPRVELNTIQPPPSPPQPPGDPGEEPDVPTDLTPLLKRLEALEAGQAHIAREVVEHVNRIARDLVERPTLRDVSGILTAGFEAVGQRLGTVEELEPRVSTLERSTYSADLPIVNAGSWYSPKPRARGDVKREEPKPTDGVETL